VIPFDFAEYLDLAEELAVRGDEAALRTAISRAYYAILHVAYRALPASAQATISHRTTHRVIWQFYADSTVQACRQIGQAGFRLQRARVEADYRAVMSTPLAMTPRHIVDARQAMERLRRHGYQP
jgi:uncharacterized protein (UPF0332 family)